MKNLGKIAVNVVRESRKFSGHPYRPYGAHNCAAIFAIAQLSCTIASSPSYCTLYLQCLFCKIVFSLF